MVRTETLELNVGPQHPSTHGVLRMNLTLDGEVIVKAQPHIGYLHRGIEKMAENRTYQQIIPLTDRLDYVGSVLNNFGYCHAVEKLAGIEVPERAEYLRVISGELARIGSHLAAIFASGADSGAITMFFYAFREREPVLDLLEAVCGARLTFNYHRIGGVSGDAPDGWLEQVGKVCEALKPAVDDLQNLLLNNIIFKERTQGVGVLSAEDALRWGASGPVLRGSGVAVDMRRSDPYSVYDRFEFDVPTGENGDSWDRMLVRYEEVRQSIRIIEQAIDGIPDGDYINRDVPRLLSPEPGECYGHVEGTKGELGFFLVSDGSPKPYRLKIRSCAYSNLALTELLVPGHNISDLVIILGSLDPVFGEVDR